MICEHHAPRFQIGFVGRPPVTHGLAIPFETGDHCDDGHIVGHCGPYRGVVLIPRVRVTARATQTVHDEVDPKLCVELAKGFGDGRGGGFGGAKAGRVDESEGTPIEREGVGGEGFGAGTDICGNGRLGDACDHIDKGADADAYLADYDNVENVLDVGEHKWGVI